MKRPKLIFTAVLLFAAASLFAQQDLNIAATNSWTAAFVRMAGGNADQLAPSDMEHPPEYELKPSDVRKIRDADLLVFAGYEALMSTVFESFDKPEEQMVRIMTNYLPATAEDSVLKIAEKLGTIPEAERNIRAYEALIEDSRDKIREAGLDGASVVVNFHQAPLAEALGFRVIGVFGPQPLEAGKIAELAELEPEMILDNAHNPMAAPLEEILGLEAVVLINFPGFPAEDGSAGPETLGEVVEYNVERLLER